MIEKGCQACAYLSMRYDEEPCCGCQGKNFEPSDLYTAYLAAVERAEKAEARAERFRQALNCRECGGRGEFNMSSGGVVIRNSPRKCDACSDIRKEARGE